AIAQDLVREPRHALGWLFGPPGWSPDGSRETSREIKARWAKLPREAAGGGPRPEEGVVEGASGRTTCETTSSPPAPEPCAKP
ncbi:MAG TPA: hypothetical protein VFE18_07745, partial [Phenylobacterium sp.]|nr:hypothetical protein [Phenylobacterium sp.]